MELEIKLRDTVSHMNVTVVCGNTEIDLGLFGDSDALELIEALESVVIHLRSWRETRIEAFRQSAIRKLSPSPLQSEAKADRV